MKAKAIKEKSELSRRDFIKTSAALGAASLAVGTIKSLRRVPTRYVSV